MIESNNSFEEKTLTGTEPVKKKKSRTFLYGILCGIWISIILYALGSIVGWAVNYKTVSGQAALSKEDDAEVVDGSTASKMMAIENVVDKYYLEEVDKETLENGIYTGMVESLGDPY